MLLPILIAIGSSELIRRHTNFCKLFWKNEGQEPAFVRALDRSPVKQQIKRVQKLSVLGFDFPEIQWFLAQTN